jgi:N-[(2S)-2-amino-2-carboxyethyl]-L-glutamate dehydrogenase
METTATAEDRILYLSRRDVRRVCARIDPVAAVREALARHARNETVLPAEAYLRWTVPGGEWARSLNMPGRIGGRVDVAGTKIINANPANPRRGLPRASGLTTLFDPGDARIYCVLEAAYISALRTASVSALAIELLNGNIAGKWALIGAGELARAHLDLLPSTVSKLGTISLFDVDGERARALHGEFAERLDDRGIRLHVANSARDATRDADVIVTATTTTTGYIAHDWLKPGALLIHVSLDDVLPEVVLNADKVVVDDWALVRDDDKRLLGRMYRQGLITAPDRPSGTAGPEAAAPSTAAARVHAELGDIVIGRRPGRSTAEEIILVNPFGLSLEDLSVAKQVYENARRLGVGVWLER